MTTNNHPIQLNNVFFTRSVIISIPEHKPNDEVRARPGAENKITLNAIEGESGRYQVTMHTTLNLQGDPAEPYMIDMECIGVFTVDETVPADEIPRAVTITAHSVLYGAIREAIAWITGRQAFGQLMLGLSVLHTEKAETTK